jgi:hypothetical protein
MKTRARSMTDRYGWLGLLVVLAAALGVPSTMWALNTNAPWTSVGSAGTVDEADINIVQFGTNFLESGIAYIAYVKSSAPLPAYMESGTTSSQWMVS